MQMKLAEIIMEIIWKFMDAKRNLDGSKWMPDG